MAKRGFDCVDIDKANKYLKALAKLFTEDGDVELPNGDKIKSVVKFLDDKSDGLVSDLEQYADDAEDYRDTAEDYYEKIEKAIESGLGGNLYTSKDDGINDTSDGELFTVASEGDVVVYKNDDGDAKEQSRNVTPASYFDYLHRAIPAKTETRQVFGSAAANSLVNFDNHSDLGLDDSSSRRALVLLYPINALVEEISIKAPIRFDNPSGVGVYYLTPTEDGLYLRDKEWIDISSSGDLDHKLSIAPRVGEYIAIRPGKETLTNVNDIAQEARYPMLSTFSTDFHVLDVGETYKPADEDFSGGDRGYQALFYLEITGQFFDDAHLQKTNVPLFENMPASMAPHASTGYYRFSETDDALVQGTAGTKDAVMVSQIHVEKIDSSKRQEFAQGITTDDDYFYIVIKGRNKHAIAKFDTDFNLVKENNFFEGLPSDQNHIGGIDYDFDKKVIWGGTADTSKWKNGDFYIITIDPETLEVIDYKQPQYYTVDAVAVDDNFVYAGHSGAQRDLDPEGCPRLAVYFKSDLSFAHSILMGEHTILNETNGIHPDRDDDDILWMTYITNWHDEGRDNFPQYMTKMRKDGTVLKHYRNDYGSGHLEDMVITKDGELYQTAGPHAVKADSDWDTKPEKTDISVKMDESGTYRTFFAPNKAGGTILLDIKLPDTDNDVIILSQEHPKKGASPWYMHLSDKELYWRLAVDSGDSSKVGILYDPPRDDHLQIALRWAPSTNGKEVATDAVINGMQVPAKFSTWETPNMIELGSGGGKHKKKNIAEFFFAAHVDAPLDNDSIRAIFDRERLIYESRD